MANCDFSLLADIRYSSLVGTLELQQSRQKLRKVNFYSAERMYRPDWPSYMSRTSLVIISTVPSVLRVCELNFVVIAGISQYTDLRRL